MKSGPARRCAIYTRKSSEQGLEQDFNSLDAQREAAVAYIASQKHDGWILLDTLYDDGGWSGGNMDRPALKTLLTDVELGKIDIIVVYKVDRLTRSLADFAKLVEAFDRKGVSFVSVTQQFNTTTSMGRLTLNVLLSFAQFEREVTGERIRDKVLASKKKGIFMGGNPPLGYDIADRKLNVNVAEAEQVRAIFRLYLELRCVRRLKQAQDQLNLRSKSWVTSAGRLAGGKSFSKGALYYLLKNRGYLGETIHKGKVYPGEHEAIVPPDLFQAVQALLEANRLTHRSGSTAKSPSLLRGLIKDSSRRPMTPSHSNKGGQRHRYYISSIARDSTTADLGPVLRLPAIEIETVVINQIQALLKDSQSVMRHLGIVATDINARGDIEDIAESVTKRLAAGDHKSCAILQQLLTEVRASASGLEIDLTGRGLREVLGLEKLDRTGDGLADQDLDLAEAITLKVECRLQRHGAGKRIFMPAASSEDREVEVNGPLVKALAQAYLWRTQLEGEGLTIQSIADRAGVSRSLVSMHINLAFMAPDIIEAILDGRQSRSTQLEKLAIDLPLAWAEQRQYLL